MGTTGLDGPTGPAGLQCPMGHTGLDGPTGSAGLEGPMGTSIVSLNISSTITFYTQVFFPSGNVQYSSSGNSRYTVT